MSPLRNPGQLTHELQDVAAELDLVTRQVRGVEARVRATVGSSATGVDRRMLSALSQVSGSTRGAQQALSAAAGSMRRIRESKA